MPIAVRAVSEQAFSTWLEEAKKKFAERRRERRGQGRNSRRVSPATPS